jgi:Ca-activated chloride channel homolog
VFLHWYWSLPASNLSLSRHILTPLRNQIVGQMRSILLTFLAFGFAIAANAQSGRIKPAKTPEPRIIVGPSVLTLPAAKTAPPPTPTPLHSKDESDELIKVRSVLVPIPVSVTDSSGRSVSTLGISDFELKVDGKPAEIADLARSETPIRLAMLFDNSSSVLIARDFERQAAQRFFKRVIRPDKDKAALFSVADSTQLEMAITSEVGRLTAAIERFPDPKGATALLDGILEVSEYMRSFNGRRVVVIVSDGEDTYSDMATSLETVVRSLLSNDCQVYVVKTKDFENYKLTGVRGGNANIRALTAERRMIEIAQQTGGTVYSPIDENEMNAAFNRISAELSQQYILSYYPEETADKGGEFRSITLSVKNRPDLTVRTRKGYYVPKK